MQTLPSGDVAGQRERRPLVAVAKDRAEAERSAAPRVAPSQKMGTRRVWHSTERESWRLETWPGKAGWPARHKRPGKRPSKHSNCAERIARRGLLGLNPQTLGGPTAAAVLATPLLALRAQPSLRPTSTPAPGGPPQPRRRRRRCPPRRGPWRPAATRPVRPPWRRRRPPSPQLGRRQGRR